MIKEIRIATLFPNIFPGILGVSCLKRALDDNIWNLHIDDLRKFGIGSYKSVDDYPFGGGAGMLIRADVIDKWLNSFDALEYHLIYTSPRGNIFTNQMLIEWKEYDKIAILCGRYEGIDSRVLYHWPLHEISIGDFILAGGEVAACVMIEAYIRQLPNVLRNYKSLIHESSATSGEYDQFTKPKIWKPQNSHQEYTVPDVLLSGNHAKIEEWKSNNRKIKDINTK